MFERGWEFRKRWKSASDFFSLEDSIATFRASNLVPVDKDRLIIFVIVGSSTVKQCFKTAANRGSSAQYLGNSFHANLFLNSYWVKSF